MVEMTAEQAFSTAVEHYNAGRLRDAEIYFERILAAVPDDPEVLHMLALTMHQLGRGSAGIELLRHAIDLRPKDAGYRSNLGAMLASYGEPEKGAAELRRALSLNPDLADAHNNLGNILKTLGEPDEALLEYRRAVACRADFAEGHNNLGASLHEHGLAEEAIAELKRTLEIRPNYPEALNNLANVLHDLGRLDQAIDLYRKAITVRPNYAEAHHHLGVSLRDLNRLGDAMKEFRTALELRPKYPEALWSISFLMLLQGDYPSGWRTFEARTQLPNRSPFFDLAGPMWDGSPLNGKSIMLYGEQGLGDCLQFIRYVPMVKARGGRVAVACPSPLKPLLQGQLGIEHIAIEGEALPPCDTQCLLMSLPRIFQTTVQSIPATVPYITADPALARSWQTRLASQPGKIKVGVAWAGNRQHLNDRNRSIPLSALAPIARLPGVRLISLQKGDAAAEIQSAGIDIVDWTTELNDLADTAAFIANLDLVISVDTSVAHLAGAMGKKTWTLLPFAPDWRWMLNRPDTPWYPTMRLFRQPAFGDWATPITQLAAELMSLPPR